jgi:tripartite-type tricarboxylate transporter receptor subunit TctC
MCIVGRAAMIRRRHAALPLLALLSAPARAEERYPSRPITLVVPYPPGGTTDNAARPVAQKLGEALGQPVVIENRGGAGGSVGAGLVAQAKPDGYTLLAFPTAVLTISPHMLALPYDAARAFVPVAMLCFGDAPVAMHPSVPVRGIRDLIAYAKASPAPLRFGSAGNGTITQMTGELFAEAAGIRLEHVPYRGSAPALTDLLAGRVQLQFDPVATPAVKDGRLVGLAVAGDRRSAELPDLPTLKELGLGGDEGLAYFGLAAPAGTPPEVVERLVAALGPVLALPEVARAMAPVGLRPNFEAGAAFAERLRRDREVFGAAVQRTGAKAE